MTGAPDRPPASSRGVGRRGFLTGAALGGAAAAISTPGVSVGQTAGIPSPAPAPAGKLQAPPAVVEKGRPIAAAPQTTSGGDFMVDVLRSVGIEHLVCVAGGTFRGLHDSIINYGMLSEPKLDLITVMHEEQSVAFAHGYAKVTGKPMACAVHSTVGLQHASMALYNAWCDRAPVFCIAGAHLDPNRRVSWVDWVHSVNDGPALVRDFTKWDDTPLTLQHFAQSTVRAYHFATTPPYGPVVIAADMDLQEDPIPAGGRPAIPKLPPPSAPQAEDSALRDVARMLVAADSPVLVLDRTARTPQGLENLVELAETLQCAVVDPQYSRMNFPWRHPLHQTESLDRTLRGADLVLGLEKADLADALRFAPASARKISISAFDLYKKPNYQDAQPLAEVDLALAADSEASLPSLIEFVKQALPANRRSTLADRGAKLAEAHRTRLAQSREAAAVGWDSQPITTARLYAELHEQVRKKDWALVSHAMFQNNWPQKLWSADRHYQFIGDAGAYGLGYLPGAAMGAAFAHQPHGRLAVAVGGDGDLMFSPSVLWAAAHQKIPILYIVHNNRAWHQEIMGMQEVAAHLNRGMERVGIGTTITDPTIDFAGLAKSMGVHGMGPILDPKDLGPALKTAIGIVERGEPVLLDVVCQGR